MRRRTTSLVGNVIAILFYGGIILIIINYLKCNEQRETSSKLADLQKNFDYNIDSLKNTVQYSEEKLNDKPPIGKTIVFYRDSYNNEVQVDFSSIKFLPKKLIAFHLKELKIITLIDLKEKQVGTYNLGAKAMQKYAIIKYINPKNNLTLYESEVYGSKPPTNVTSRGPTTEISGSPPDNNDIIKQILSDIQ